jgi:menaquinone-dependent protoporphyrinogen oxidase
VRVLIAYGSRYGSTEEIASRLAEFLKEEGVEAEVLDLKRERNWPPLEGFDGVMVGSGVKVGRWMNEPREFFRRKRDELKGRRLAVFVSCFSALNAPDYARTDLLEKVMEEAGVKVDLYEAFGPLVDFSKGSRIGFLDKKVAQTVMSKDSEKTGIKLDMDGRNDLRDWERIREFARRFAELLKEQPRAD